MILVAGPYRSGTNDDPKLIAANVKAMTDAALDIYRIGHLPVMGEWFALPLIEAAGSKKIGDDIFNEIFHPIAVQLIDHCDCPATLCWANLRVTTRPHFPRRISRK